MTPSLSFGWSVGIHLYSLFMTAALVGIILFVVWTLRLNQEQLKKWVIGLIAVGLVRCLLTFQYGWSAFMGMGQWMMKNSNPMMRGSMMNQQ